MIRASLLLLALALPLLSAPRPQLVVLIVAEQFRPDYLDRYRVAFSPGGFNRFLKGGAVFRDCRYGYLATFPAPGAAVLATGAYPEHNGIVAENWYDRSAHRVVRAVEDPDFGSSPRNLTTTTLADQMRLASDGRSRVLSISLRDQTAVLLGGRRPKGCYWFDEAGRFVTSSYYSATLPDWVAEFEKTHPSLRFRGQPWKAMDAKESSPPLRMIDGQGARGLQDFFATYFASPLAIDEQFDFARAGVQAEELGEGPATDLLVLSISSLYLLGLEAGADSPLVRDMVLRLDQKMDAFFSWLDERLGAENVWTIFAATQGLPESAAALEAADIRSGRIAGDDVAGAVNARLSVAYGRARYVEKYVFPSLYLRHEAIDNLIGTDALLLAGEAVLAVPGVAGYLAVNRASSFLTPDSVSRLSRSTFPGRSGDILVAYQPYYWERYGDGRGVSPGSYYSYDARVPLLFHGTAFRSVTVQRPISPTDFAPTLAAALDIPPPASATGRVLVEALKEK